jgi:hypothetical protein
MTNNGKFPDNIPLIGQKPRLRIEQIFVEPLRMADADGEAELLPHDDITLIELYKIQLLMLWIISHPPIPQPDPETQGRTPVVRHLQWRQYIADEQLERHFAFRMRADQQTEGSA